MSYAFAPGVTACRADGRLVVLNIRADQYLMLPPDIEAALLRLIDRRPAAPGDGAVYERLCTGGLVLRHAASPGLALCRHPLPSHSLLDEGWVRPRADRVALAGLRALGAASRLKILGMESALRGVRGTAICGEDDIDRATRTAAAFAELRLVMRALDRCLPLSIALAAAGKRRHRSVRLVLGVQCDPFGAHAWVQLGSSVLNDRVDSVRQFTPILVL